MTQLASLLCFAHWLNAITLEDAKRAGFSNEPILGSKPAVGHVANCERSGLQAWHTRQNASRPAKSFKVFALPTSNWEILARMVIIHLFRLSRGPLGC